MKLKLIYDWLDIVGTIEHNFLYPDRKSHRQTNSTPTPNRLIISHLW